MGIKSRILKQWSPESLVRSSIRKCYPAGSGVVLMYHEVAGSDNYVPAWTVVSSENFTAQLDFLQRYFDIVSLDEALVRTQQAKSETHSGEEKTEIPFAVVTFDDGYQGNLTEVLPVMEARNLPFTVYVATEAIMTGTVYWYDRLIGLLINKQDLTFDLTGTDLGRVKVSGARGPSKRWEQLRPVLEYLKTLSPEAREVKTEELVLPYKNLKNTLRMLDRQELKILAANPLVTLGGHTHRHELLDQLSEAAVRETLDRNRRELVEITGVQPAHFAYPNGNFTQEVRQLVEDRNWKSAVTTKIGVFDKNASRYEIPRFGIGAFDSLDLIKAKLARWL